MIYGITLQITDRMLVSQSGIISWNSLVHLMSCLHKFSSPRPACSYFHSISDQITLLAFCFSTVVIHGVVIAGKIHTNKEYLSFKPNAYGDGSSEDTGSHQDSPQPIWRSSRFRMRVLCVLVGFSILLNAFNLLHGFGIIGSNDIEGDTFRSIFQTDFSK